MKKLLLLALVMFAVNGMAQDNKGNCRQSNLQYYNPNKEQLSKEKAQIDTLSSPHNDTIIGSYNHIRKCNNCKIVGKHNYVDIPPNISIVIDSLDNISVIYKNGRLYISENKQGNRAKTDTVWKTSGNNLNDSSKSFRVPQGDLTGWLRITDSAIQRPISDTVSAILLVSDTSTRIKENYEVYYDTLTNKFHSIVTYTRVKKRFNISYYIEGYIVTKKIQRPLEYDYIDYTTIEKLNDIIYLDADKKRITNLIVWNYRTY